MILEQIWTAKDLYQNRLYGTKSRGRKMIDANYSETFSSITLIDNCIFFLFFNGAK